MFTYARINTDKDAWTYTSMNTTRHQLRQGHTHTASTSSPLSTRRSKRVQLVGDVGIALEQQHAFVTMESNFHSNTIVMCVICSNTVIIRYRVANMVTNDHAGLYMIRLTTCHSCSTKVVRSNLNGRQRITMSTNEGTYSESGSVWDSDEEMNYGEDVSLPMNMRLFTAYNTPVGMLMIASLPMYKRLMTYLRGNMIAKTLNGFCVVEALSMLMPDPTYEYRVASVSVNITKSTKRSACGCVQEYTKEFVTEVPYEVSTFFP